ncbi:MAG: hypothetical protein JO356_10805 [Acidobacteria bacterium]|nr:hypothetical protein [Acidobacteriota bacterium]
MALTSQSNIPGGLAITGNNWTIPGTIVGGYNASDNTGSVVPPILTNPSATIYWIQATQNLQVQYSYCMVNGKCSPTAAATFNVDGPNPIVVTTTTGTWQVFNGRLSYGDPTPSATHGILFTLTPPPGYTGSYQWVQLINNQIEHVTLQDGSSYACGPASGLDTQYPYSTSNPTGDSPSVGLASNGTYEQESIDATMYLMWDPSPGSQSSIPVPLGHVDWTPTGTANYDSANGWSIDNNNSSPPSGSTLNFQNSTTYPTWAVNVVNNEGDCQ